MAASTSSYAKRVFMVGDGMPASLSAIYVSINVPSVLTPVAGFAASWSTFHAARTSLWK